MNLKAISPKASGLVLGMLFLLLGLSATLVIVGAIGELDVPMMSAGVNGMAVSVVGFVFFIAYTLIAKN